MASESRFWKSQIKDRPPFEFAFSFGGQKSESWGVASPLRTHISPLKIFFDTFLGIVPSLTIPLSCNPRKNGDYSAKIL